MPFYLRSRRSALEGYLFFVPFFVAFLLFLGLPLGYAVYISVHSWNVLTNSGSFVGLSNFRLLFAGGSYYASQFWGTLANTAVYALISVPVVTVGALCLAYLLFLASSRLRSVVRLLSFLPSVLSVTAVGTLWAYLLATNNGPVNNLVGLHAEWLTSQPLAWVSLVIQKVWLRVGIDSVILFAGMSQVPITLVEAAALDGAGYWQRFRIVVWPFIRRLALVVIIIETIDSFNLFAQAMIMTGGGPGTSTTTVTLNIYNQVFNSFNAGLGAAMALTFGVILALVAGVQYWLVMRRSS